MTQEQTDRINEYVRLLISENSKQNLIRFNDESEIFKKHIEDVLIPFSLTENSLYGNVADMGSGGGIPGVILSILFPSSDFTLVETEGRKADFLEMVAEKLRLDNLKVYNGRLETFGKEYREKYDFITSRALAAISICCEYAAPLLKTEGKLLLMKGPNYLNELHESKNAFETLSMQQDSVSEYKFDYDGEEFRHYIVTIKKTGKTPDKFPRKPGMAKKRPL